MILEVIRRLLKEDIGVMTPIPASELLELPQHLQITAAALCKLGRANAEMISKVTHRARAVESSYLNQLCALIGVKKERLGRQVWFCIKA